MQTPCRQTCLVGSAPLRRPRAACTDLDSLARAGRPDQPVARHNDLRPELRELPVGEPTRAREVDASHPGPQGLARGCEADAHLALVGGVAHALDVALGRQLLEDGRERVGFARKRRSPGPPTGRSSSSSSATIATSCVYGPVSPAPAGRACRTRGGSNGWRSTGSWTGGGWWRSAQRGSSSWVPPLSNIRPYLHRMRLNRDRCA